MHLTLTHQNCLFLGFGKIFNLAYFQRKSSFVLFWYQWKEETHAKPLVPKP